MERYIGIDAHSDSCTCSVISPTGRRAKTAVVPTTERALRDFVRSVRRPLVVVMEEGNQSDWLYEVLRPHADDVLVVQPPRTRGLKNDRVDAERLARLARLNEPGRLVFKSPQTLTALRHAAKIYRTTRQDLTRARARLKLLTQSRGLRASSRELLDEEQRNSWVEQLPAALRPRAELLGLRIDHAREAHETAREWMLRESRGVKAIQWLESIPGIGEIRAAMIVSTIISPHRFRTKRQLWSYSGLAVVVRSSSDWERSRDGIRRRRGHQRVLGLNRNRNPVLKDAFTGAAQQIISRMSGHPLHAFYEQRIENGTKASVARVVLARKLAAIALAIWKKKEEYDPKLS